MRFQAMFAALIAIVAFSFTTTKVVTYTADVSESTVEWKGEKVTGFHTGNLSLKSGAFEFSEGVLTGGNFTVDMTSLTVTDIEDPGTNGKLVGHLKSPDFFGVEAHPEASFVITKVVSRGKVGEYKLIGDITVKGITKEIRFNANVTQEGTSANGTAEITLDRTDFDVRYGSGSFFDNLGDKTIYDEFTLTLNFKGVQA
ncbi:MAG: YceI family protein [Bacteroidota bacterium]